MDFMKIQQISTKIELNYRKIDQKIAQNRSKTPKIDQKSQKTTKNTKNRPKNPNFGVFHPQIPPFTLFLISANPPSSPNAASPARQQHAAPAAGGTAGAGGWQWQW
jgi:hypothetical protein